MEDSPKAGWIVAEGPDKGVRVAPWVIKEQKKELYYSLVGILKNKEDGVRQTERWLVSYWGKMPAKFHLLEDQMALVAISFS